MARIRDSDDDYVLYEHIFPNGKRYFGITSQKPEYRWRGGDGYRFQQLMYRAILKYGWDNIEHIIIATRLSHDWACVLEQLLIANYHTNNIKYGYNNTDGGEGIKGYHLTDEQKEVLRKASTGRHHSEETKHRLSEMKKGIPAKLSDEQHRLKSERMKGTALHKGYKHSDETKRILSEKAKGKVRHAKPHSEEAKRKIGEASKGRIVSEATREKLRQKAIEQWKRKKGE